MVCQVASCGGQERRSGGFVVRVGGSVVPEESAVDELWWSHAKNPAFKRKNPHACASEWVHRA